MISCDHHNVVESTDGRDDRRDDRLTHWRCLDCDDRFPLIGDTDKWAPKVLLPNPEQAGVTSAEREFVGDDGHDWHVVRWPSASCGANYADVERVDGTKASVRQAELLRRAGIALPESSE